MNKRFTKVVLVAAALLGVFSGAALAQYNLPQDNPFAPAPGTDALEFGAGIGGILAVLFTWAARNVIGPGLVVFGGWRLFGVLKDGIQRGEYKAMAENIGIIVGGIMLVLLVSSGNWYDLLRTIWASISNGLAQIGQFGQ